MSGTKAARYLVQTEDGHIYGYQNRDVLLVHLTENRGEKVRLFRLAHEGFKIRYLPVTEAEIRTEGK